MRNFFSSPKKTSKAAKKIVESTPIPEVSDAFGKYLKKDLTIARSFVAFKDIAKRCDTKLFETSYPLIGQCAEGEGAERQLVTKTVGEIVVHIFRLPAIPGVPATELPQSLEECHRGLRHTHWHKVVYHEGILTQLGADCTVSPCYFL